MQRELLIQDARGDFVKFEESSAEPEEILCDHPSDAFLHHAGTRKVSVATVTAKVIRPEATIFLNRVGPFTAGMKQTGVDIVSSQTVTDAELAVSLLQTGVWSEHDYQSWVVDFCVFRAHHTVISNGTQNVAISILLLAIRSASQNLDGAGGRCAPPTSPLVTRL